MSLPRRGLRRAARGLPGKTPKPLSTAKRTTVVSKI